MKTEEAISKQLQEIYQHRLLLRIDRKMKKSCRNCKHGVNKEFDLGDFGTVNRWQCKDGRSCHDCVNFECLYTQQQIEKQMIDDISDPSICGAKEPKIAMLLWVLHDQANKGQKKQNNCSYKKGFFQILRGIFK